MKNVEDYIDRLYEDWTTHGKIIIALDYDDTISQWRFASKEDCIEVIKLVKMAKETGAYVVIHTACAPDRYSEIRSYCQENGLEVDSINENPIDLPYGNHRKVFANIFLDDRAGLLEAMTILETAMYRKRGADFNNSLTEQTML